MRIGAVDETRSPQDGISGIDLLIIATPIPAAVDFLRQVSRSDPGMLVTDAASVKAPIVSAARRILGSGNRFVGAHPIAGSERTGITAASDHLFDDRVTVLTPASWTDRRALHDVRRFWEALGCRIVEMPAHVHDRALAVTSHLPHLVSFALAAAISAKDRAGRMRRLAGQGVKDATRIAASNEEMWADIFLFNRKFVVQACRRFEGVVREMRDAVSSGNRAALVRTLRKARRYRESLDG